MNINWSKKVTVSDKQEDHKLKLKAERDAAISETDWIVNRHRDEIDSGVKTTLDKAAYTLLLEHRQSLRDLTKQKDWHTLPIPSIDIKTLK